MDDWDWLIGIVVAIVVLYFAITYWPITLLAGGGAVGFYAYKKEQQKELREDLGSKKVRLDEAVNELNQVNAQSQEAEERIQAMGTQRETLAADFETLNRFVSFFSSISDVDMEFEKGIQVLEKEVEGHEKAVAEIEARSKALSIRRTQLRRKIDGLTEDVATIEQTLSAKKR